ncbi:MAG: diguanylate cyclase, partial [Gemmata sp.]
MLDVLCAALRDEGFVVTGCSEPAVALAALPGREFELLLTDLLLPGSDGIRLLEEARWLDPGLAGVIMTGHGSIPAAVAAMQAGACDFVLKPFRMAQVLAVLDRALAASRHRADNQRLSAEVARTQAERVRLLEEDNARLTELATTDPLTALANRRAFDAALAREVALATRGNHPLSVALFDIDHFKGFNDEFGHPAGDEALRQVSERIRRCCRAADVAARLGGEEFAVLLPHTSLSGAVPLAERVRESVAAGPWQLRLVTVSAGVATLDGNIEGAGVVPAADAALFTAKRNGRNRVAAHGECATGR